ncbi:MAG: nuclear transport factor 2 family protein [Gemmatimonadota bacterium]
MIRAPGILSGENATRPFGRRVLSITFALSLFWLTAFLVTPVSGQDSAFTPLPSIILPPELDRVLRDYERAWRAGDEAALAALFTTDGVVPSPQGWVRGVTDIEKAYREGAGPLSLRAVAYGVEGATGYIVGTFGYDADPATTQRGKFILALRRAPDGRWLIVADLDG